MNKKLIIFTLMAMIICLSKVFAGERNFINHTNHKIEIRINGLMCKDYPPRFSRCSPEQNQTVILLLNSNESALLSFNHYLIGKIRIKDLNINKIVYQKTFSNRAGIPLFDSFNYCYAIIFQMDKNNRIANHFNGCVNQ